MAIFYSFHYGNDSWRVQQIRNIGVLDDADVVAAQEWESVRCQTDVAIEKWIDSAMSYKRAVVVLIGSETASRRWVQYEIRRAWELKRPLLGIRIHDLKDQYGNTDLLGENPFYNLDFQRIPVFDPSGLESTAKFADIRRNLSTWVKQGYKRP